MRKDKRREFGEVSEREGERAPAASAIALLGEEIEGQGVSER